MKLKKGLGLLHVFCIASGAMISSGLFVLSGLAHARAGPAVVVSYFLAGLLATTGLLSIAELATAMPRAGGDYFFISRAMGPAVGSISGLLNWFSLSLKSAFAVVGMAAFAKLVIPVDHRLTGVLLCAVFVVLNLIGVKAAARLQVALVLGLFALMLLYIVRGAVEVNVQYFEPFAPHGARAVFSTAGFVFVSYGGLLKIVSMGEEVRNPGRVIPLGMILSLLAVTVCYTFMVFITSGVLGAAKLDHSLTPISDAAAVFMGSSGKIALGVAAILAFLTTANAGIMAASRYLFAVSRDGLLPSPLAKVSTRFGTPYLSILFTGGLIVVGLFVELDLLVRAASCVFMMSYVLSSASVVVLRESGVQNYRPRFRAPLYPWIQIVGIIGFAFVILEMGEKAFLTTATLVTAGFLTYWFYGREKVRRESALLHLIERITAKELVTGSLETELKQIIRERDEIVLDRFDSVIEESTVLDIGGAMEADDFFRLVAKKAADRVKVASSTLFELLRARERESSTVLRPGLAIPHIVIGGKNMFDILLVRCREGTTFTKGTRRIHAAFVLLGTKDERNFHLQSLAAIAQIVQDPGFDKKWMAARGEQGLRDVILLGERRRS